MQIYLLFKIKNWLLKKAKDFIIKNIDVNDDGYIDPDEVLDFVKKLISYYEAVTGKEIKVKFK